MRRGHVAITRGLTALTVAAALAGCRVSGPAPVAASVGAAGRGRPIRHPRLVARAAHYANDPGVLVAVTAKSNRSKGDQDPARWLPALDRCGYVTRWVAVKTRFGMTVDAAEHDAIGGILAHC
jgi:hypothetical protein